MCLEGNKIEVVAMDWSGSKVGPFKATKVEGEVRNINKLST